MYNCLDKRFDIACTSRSLRHHTSPAKKLRIALFLCHSQSDIIMYSKGNEGNWAFHFSLPLSEYKNLNRGECMKIHMTVRAYGIPHIVNLLSSNENFSETG